jgi:ABC-type phosphate transport system substrate-binding protein
MNIRHAALAALLAGLAAPALCADYVVIVNKGNDNTVDKSLVARLYLGETKSWPGGGSVALIDLPEDNPARAGFDNEVVGKSPASLKSLWAQNVFTGKALPPKVMQGDDDVKKAVAANRNAIGYIKPASLDDSVKAAVR